MIKEAAKFLKSKGLSPDTFVVLGSGLGNMISELEYKRIDIPFSEIPGFPELTVHGHTGEISYIETDKSKFLFYRGRKHYYEDVSTDDLLFAHRTAKELGCTRGILTCSAGSVNPAYAVGDLVQVVDYLDIQFIRPMPSMIKDSKLSHRAEIIHTCDNLVLRAADMGIHLHRGVLIALLGPTYETNAEVEMCRYAGADLVSMSTAPEIFALKLMGLPWLSFSVVTNVAGMMHAASHDEVLQQANKASRRLLKLIMQL